ncbi:MAG: hypothetical protein V1854_05255 [Methanobacteriota archaeon]
MKPKNYLLSHKLQIRIQGLLGEIVALDYALENLKVEAGDEVIITTNRCNKHKFKEFRASLGVHFHTINQSAFEFLRHELVDYFLRVGCEGIDLANADIEAKNFFEKYMSKTKEQILSEFEQLYTDYRKEREIDRENREKMKEFSKLEDVGISESNELISEKIKTLSHKDLAKLLALIELEKHTREKGMFKSDTSAKISSLVTFSNLLFPLNIERTGVDYKLMITISHYVNAKYDELKILSSVFKSIVETKTVIDSMIVHCSAERTLKKLIIIECKTGNSPLTKNQKAFIDCIKQMKSDKVEYKYINVDYQAPKQLTVSENWIN